MQHIQPNTPLLSEKYRIEQKPCYLKVYLANPADCEIVKKSISLLKCVKSVNVTHPKVGDLTVHPVSKVIDSSMIKDVEQALIDFYSFTADDNITLKQTKRLTNLMPKNSQERNALESAMKSYSELRYRHAFDDMRLCFEYLLRKIYNSNEGMNKLLDNFKKDLKSKGFTPNLSASIIDIIRKFDTYQNENVKHHNNISLTDTMTIFTWGNMVIEQMILLDKMLNWKRP